MYQHALRRNAIPRHPRTVRVRMRAKGKSGTRANLTSQTTKSGMQTTTPMTSMAMLCAAFQEDETPPASVNGRRMRARTAMVCRRGVECVSAQAHFDAKLLRTSSSGACARNCRVGRP